MSKIVNPLRVDSVIINGQKWWAVLITDERGRQATLSFQKTYVAATRARTYILANAAIAMDGDFPDQRKQG